MTKKFPLQRVLEFKEQVEDLLEIQVAGIEGHRQELQQRVDHLREKWGESSCAQQSEGGQLLDPAEGELVAVYLDALDRTIQSEQQSLENVQRELEHKRIELGAAYQEREILKKLKAKQEAAERLAEQRRDTRALEDVATQQYVRRNADAGPGGVV